MHHPAGPGQLDPRACSAWWALRLGRNPSEQGPDDPDHLSVLMGTSLDGEVPPLPWSKYDFTAMHDVARGVFPIVVPWIFAGLKESETIAVESIGFHGFQGPTAINPYVL